MMTKDQIDAVDRVLIAVCVGLITAGSLWILLAAYILMR